MIVFDPCIQILYLSSIPLKTSQNAYIFMQGFALIDWGSVENIRKISWEIFDQTNMNLELTFLYEWL